MSLSIGTYKKDKTKTLGTIRFGKERPDKTKYILVDITYDKKAERELCRIGMELLAKDKPAVINYCINKAMENTLKHKAKK